MPKIDMNAYANASSGTSFKSMDPGVYACKVVRVNTTFDDFGETKSAERDKMAQFVVDVVDGEFADEFSRDFYNGKDYIHAVKVGWENDTIWQLKQLFTVLESENPGFDPMAAFKADRWRAFEGKRLHVLFNGYERTNDKGYTNVNVRASKPCAEGGKAVPKVKRESGEWVDWEVYQVEKTAARSGMDVKFEPVDKPKQDGYYSDIPF